MKLIDALRFAQEIKARESRHKTILVYSSFLNRFIEYWTV